MTTLEILVLLIVVIMLVGALPPLHLQPYGPAPSAMLVLVLLIVLLAIYARRTR